MSNNREYWDEKKLKSKRIEKQMRFFFDRFPYKGKLFFYYAWKYRLRSYRNNDKITLLQRYSAFMRVRSTLRLSFYAHFSPNRNNRIAGRYQKCLQCPDLYGYGWGIFCRREMQKSRNETGISGDFRLMQPSVDKFYSLLSCMQLPEMV